MKSLNNNYLVKTAILSLLIMVLLSACNNEKKEKEEVKEIVKGAVDSVINAAKMNPSLLNDTLLVDNSTKEDTLRGEAIQGGELKLHVKFKEVKKINLELKSVDSNVKMHFYFVNEYSKKPYTLLHSFDGPVMDNFTYTVGIDIDSASAVKKGKFLLRIIR